jgi:hypothetical protein
MMRDSSTTEAGFWASAELAAAIAKTARKLAVA